MAEMKFEFECCARPTVEFSGTVDELIEFARKYGGDNPAEIEGPVRVGDTIEITDKDRRMTHYTVGKRYEVVDTFDGHTKPIVIDDDGDTTSVMLAKYRIVARKEESPRPAKPSVKVGDYIVFDVGSDCITSNKPYKVFEINLDRIPLILDDDGDTNGLALKQNYRIITDARELAFAKAGRKLNEFKAGDIVRFISWSGAGPYPVGSIAEVEETFDRNGFFSFGERYTSSPKWAELVAPAEARVDAE